MDCALEVIHTVGPFCGLNISYLLCKNSGFKTLKPVSQTTPIIPDRYFTKVGNTLLKYEDDLLSFYGARERCAMSYDANLVEFRNEKEWTEVITKQSLISLSAFDLP